MPQDQERFGDDKFNLDGIVRKYLSVWIWSILVGINTTVTFSFMEIHFRSRGSYLIMLMGPLIAIGVLIAILSWYYLFKHFRVAIVTLLVGNGASSEHALRAARSLDVATGGVFFALALRLVIGVLDFVLDSLGSFDGFSVSY